MSEWKCGNCGKVYDIYEFISMKKIKLVENDTNPKEQHGYTSVCECGYRFFIDRWKMNDNIKIKANGEELELTISTVFLELNHKMFDEKDEYYETAILELNKIDDKIKNIEIMKRYGTKEEAIEDHNRMLNLLKDGKYKVENITILENEENRIVFDEQDQMSLIY